MQWFAQRELRVSRSKTETLDSKYDGVPRGAGFLGGGIILEAKRTAYHRLSKLFSSKNLDS